MEAAADFSGWAFKQGSKVKNWKKRFFVLRGRALLYYAGQHASGCGVDEKGRVVVVGVELDDSKTMLLITCERKSQLLRLRPATATELPVWLAQLHRAAAGGGVVVGSPAHANDRRVGGLPPQPVHYARDASVNATNLFGTDLHDELDGDASDVYSFQQPSESVEDYYKSAQPPPPPPPAKLVSPRGHNDRSKLVESTIAIDDNQYDDQMDDQFGDSSIGLDFGDEASARARAAPRGSLAQGQHIGVAREGWLSVGDITSNSSWKKRYAVLAGPTFTYFASKGTGDALESLWVTRVSLSSSKPNALELALDSGRVVGIAADSREELIEWERALASVLGTRVLLRSVSSKDENETMDDTYGDGRGGSGRRPSSYAGVFREGWLLVKQGFGKNEWARRYFVLNGATLQERETPTSKAEYGSFVIHMNVNNDSSVAEFELELMSGRFLKLQAENAVDAEAWIHALSDLVGTPVATTSSTQPAAQSMSLSSPVIRPPVNILPPQQVKKTGWLMKEGGMIKSWKRRYFVLDGDTFRYFDKVNGNMLGGGTVFRVVRNSATANSVDVHFLNGRILRISSETRTDIDAWFEALRLATASSIHNGHYTHDVASTGGDTPSSPSDGIVQRGWLLKRGQMMKTWKRRYFVIQRNRLTYCSTVGGELLGSGAVFDVAVGSQRPLSLDVRFQNGRLLHVAAADDEDFKQWHDALRTASNISESFLSQASLSQEEPLFEKDHFDDDAQDDASVLAEDGDGGDDLYGSDHGDDESTGYGMWDAAMKDRPSVSRDNSWDSALSESNNNGNDSDGGGSVTRELHRQYSDNASTSGEPRGCSGWLRKEGGHVKNWKRRYFTLHGTTLKYFKSAKGSLLRSDEVVHVEETPATKFGFAIDMRSGRRLVVTAESTDEYEKWLLALWGVLADQRASLTDGHGYEGDGGGRYSAVGIISVKSVPTSPVAHGSSSSPAVSKTHSGWLEKEGQRFKTWKKRYFTVKNGALMYFNDIGGETQGHGTVHGVSVDKTKPNTLRIRLGKDRVMRVTAATAAETTTWLQVLTASQRSPRGVVSPRSEAGDDLSEMASSAGSAALDLERRSLSPVAPSSPVAPQQGRSRFDESDYLKNDTITNDSFLRIRGPGDDLSLTEGSFYKPRSFKGDLPLAPTLTTPTEDADDGQLARIDSEDDIMYLKSSSAERERLEAMRKKKELEMLPAQCAPCCVVM